VTVVVTPAAPGVNPTLPASVTPISLITFTTDGTPTTNSADQVNVNCRGIVVNVNISAITGTSPTLTVTIQGKDTLGSAYYTLLASAALNATGSTQLTVYPGSVVTSNVSANGALPNVWRVSAAIGGTTPAVTATIGAVLIP